MPRQTWTRQPSKRGYRQKVGAKENDKIGGVYRADISENRINPPQEPDGYPRQVLLVYCKEVYVNYPSPAREVEKSTEWKQRVQLHLAREGFPEVAGDGRADSGRGSRLQEQSSK